MEVIKLKNINKFFNICHEKRDTLLDQMITIFKGSSDIEKFHVLNDINLSIQEGECIGVIGRNGSGKTTLLKIIANILKPTSGEIKTVGKIMPFIELGVGFNPELTGKENIYLYGAILGLSKEYIDLKFEEIVEFAQLENFIDTKLKNYSSGMEVRLAFATALLQDPDILLIDEILAVGDETFRKRSLNKMLEFIKNGKTVIFVSHSLPEVKSICDRALLISGGTIDMIGKTELVIDHYLGQIYLEDKQSFEEKLLKKEQMIEELQSKYNKLIKISNPPPQEELMIIQRELEILRDSKLNLIKDLKKLIKEKLKSTESLILEYTNEIALLKNKLKYLGEREKKAEEECQLSELEKRRSELLNSKQKFFQELVLLIKNEVPKTDFDESTQEIEGLLKFEITKTQDSDYRNNLLNELKSFFRTLLNTAKNKKYADRLREEVKNLLYFQLDFAIDDVYRKKMKIELEELLRQQIDATPDALHKARLINELKDLVSDSIKRSVISDSVF